MTDGNNLQQAKFALVFIRPVKGLSEEVQMRMIDKAVKQLDIKHAIFKSPIDRDREDERGDLLRACRGNEAVIVARLNVLGRNRKETNGRPVSREFMLFVNALQNKCKYILVLDDNLPDTPVNTVVTSRDKNWEAVFDRAIDVVANSRNITPERSKSMNKQRWAGEFRGVKDEWLNSPERAEEREAMTNIWCSHQYKTAKEAFEAMPESVRKQIKNTQMAGKIFGPRRPGSALGRPKKN